MTTLTGTIRSCIALLALLLAAPVLAVQWQDSPAVSALFSKAQVHGTFVLYDLKAKRLTGHNYARAENRFFPASTFKIPNTLIGLSTGAVKSVDEVLPYGGQPQAFKHWEQDMSLRDAIRISNVPVYQELARRIGIQRMSNAVNRLEYGTGNIGSVVDTFWLEGPLAISAIEQTQFLGRLAQEKLPFPKAAQRQVREITRLETGPDWILYGKTGWATANKPGIGWWVGWVEKQEQIYAFAMNMDMPTSETAGQRIELGKASLQALGILP